MSKSYPVGKEAKEPEAEDPGDGTDRRLRKLEAETDGVGTVGMLLAGFALAMIPEAEAADSAECSDCPLWSATTNATIVDICYYFYVLSLSLVATASALATIFSTSANWQGKKILAKRSGDATKSLKTFDAYWDSVKAERKFVRAIFYRSLPLFLISVAASPKVWCGDCVLGVLMGTLLVASGGISYYVAWKHVLKGVKK
jgi:hypothetical protein